MPDHKSCASYDRAISLRAAGDSSLAVEDLQRLLAENGDDGRTWELLGGVAYAQDDFDTAQSALERASVLVPLSATAQLVLAKCYDRAGHRESAAAIYRHVAMLGNLTADMLEPLASGLGRCGEVELALSICRRAAEALPDNPDPLIGMVHYMRRLRRPAEQILPILFRAHHLDPENSEYRISLAWMLHVVGRSDEGAKLLATVPCERFTCIRCLTLMRQIFERVGDIESAAVCRKRLAGLTGECSARREGWGGES